MRAANGSPGVAGSRRWGRRRELGERRGRDMSGSLYAGRPLQRLTTRGTLARTCQCSKLSVSHGRRTSPSVAIHPEVIARRTRTGRQRILVHRGTGVRLRRPAVSSSRCPHGRRRQHPGIVNHLGVPSSRRLSRRCPTLDVDGGEDPISRVAMRIKVRVARTLNSSRSRRPCASRVDQHVPTIVSEQPPRCSAAPKTDWRVERDRVEDAREA